MEKVSFQGGGFGSNPFDTCEGYDKIMRLLLVKGTEDETPPWYDGTLQAASSGGHDKIMQLLLEKGANINSQTPSEDFENALQAASYKGHDIIVQLLLEKGAEVNTQGGWYGNALQAASFEGHDRVVQLLLDKGANVNAQGGEHENALQAASSRGYNIAPIQPSECPKNLDFYAALDLFHSQRGQEWSVAKACLLFQLREAERLPGQYSFIDRFDQRLPGRSTGSVKVYWYTKLSN